MSDCRCTFPCQHACLVCAPYRDHEDCNTCTYTDERCGCKEMAEQMNRQRVHDWFSLSYSHYLVLPRVLLENMPGEWQRDFVACLNELNEHWSDEAFPSYNVQRVECECERSCDVCMNGPVDDPGCECIDGCESEVTDPLSDYRHPLPALLDSLRRKP